MLDGVALVLGEREVTAETVSRLLRECPAAALIESQSTTGEREAEGSRRRRLVQ